MANQTPLVQPPFASQLSPARAPGIGVTPVLQHGYMIWDQQGGLSGLGYAGGPYNGRAVFNFQYNPQTISASFATETTTAQASMIYNAPGASDILAIPLAQSVSWTLYLDRTYEVNFGKPNNTENDAAVIGVQADVVQLMQFTGMLSAATAGAKAKTASVNKGGVMVNVFSWTYFGKNVTPSGKHPATIFENRLGYYGFVQGWNVDYTAFTQAMVPYRATITINFQMLPSIASSYLGNGALAQGVLDPYGNLKNYVTPKKAKKP